MVSPLILTMFLSLIALVIFINKTIYCFVYEHKKWKLWKRAQILTKCLSQSCWYKGY